MSRPFGAAFLTIVMMQILSSRAPESFDNWVPAQHKAVQEAVDFRHAKTGPKGYKERNKRKLEEEDITNNEENDGDDGGAVPMEEVEHEQSTKRRKAEGVITYIPVSRMMIYKYLSSSRNTNIDKLNFRVVTGIYPTA